MLDRQNITMPFANGVDTKTDAKQVVAGKLLRLENGVFTRLKSIEKRRGNVALGSQIVNAPGTVVSNGIGLATYSDELLLAGSDKVFSYEQGSDGWVNKGKYVPMKVTKQSVIKDSNQQYNPDGAVHANGLQLYAWEEVPTAGTTIIKYNVIDTMTGQVVVTAQQLATTAVMPRVIVNSGSFLIYFCDASQTRLKLAVISASAPASTPTFYTLTAAGVNDNSLSVDTLAYDVCVIPTQAGNQIYLAFGNNNAGTTLRAYQYSDPSLQITGATQVTLPGITRCVTVFGANTIAAGNQGPVVVYSRDNGLSPYTASILFGAYTYLLSAVGFGTIATGLDYRAARLITGCNTATGAVGFTVFFAKASAFPEYTSKAVVDSAYAVTLTASWQITAAPIGKAFVQNNTVYLPIVFYFPFTLGGDGDTNQQSAYFLVDANTNIVARAMDSYAANYRQLTWYPGSLAYLASAPLANVFSPVANTFSLAVLEQVLIQGSLQDTTTNVSELTFAFNDPQTVAMHSELAGNLHLSGGFLQMYDGVSVVEHNFHLYPLVFPSTPVSGGSIAAGTYQYTVCYEWVDNEGNVHQSRPAAPKTVIVPTGSMRVPLNISYLQFTAKRADRPVQIVIYRTEASGKIFYRASSLTTPDLNVIGGSPTLTAYDGLSDADLALRPALYTQPLVTTAPTEVENAPAPPTALVQLHRNRLFVLDSTNPLQVWYSKLPSAGTPVAFNDAWIKQIDPRGGNVTALATVDDKLLVFKQNFIFYIVGQGPNNLDLNNDFSDAIMVTSDAGCIDPRSIVGTPVGIMFQSRKGIYLIDRSLAVQYVGAPVEAFNGETITSATLVADTNQVRFTLQSGSVLVYDYFVDQWAVFTNLNAVDSLIWQSSVIVLRANGQTLRETAGVYTDAGSPIQLRIETSWLSFLNIQGFQRVRRMLVLGGWLSPHQLRIGVCVDFDETIVQQVTANPTTPTAFGGSSPYGEDVYGGQFQLYQWRLDLARQKCQTVKFTIEDLPAATATGQGVSLSSLAFEVGAKVGLAKVPASRTVS